MPHLKPQQRFLRQKLVAAFLIKLAALVLMSTLFFSADQRLNPDGDTLRQHLLTSTWTETK